MKVRSELALSVYSFRHEMRPWIARLLTVEILVENIISRKTVLLLPDNIISLQNPNLSCAQ